MPAEDSNKKIEELQITEGQLQGLLAQKQSFQIEMNSVNNALEEIKNTGEEVYRVLSGVMIKSDKKRVSEYLEEKKKMLNMKIEAIEKQEKLLEKSANELKREINDMISKSKKQH